MEKLPGEICLGLQIPAVRGLVTPSVPEYGKLPGGFYPRFVVMFRGEKVILSSPRKSNFIVPINLVINRVNCLGRGELTSNPRRDAAVGSGLGMASATGLKGGIQAPKKLSSCFPSLVFPVLPSPAPVPMSVADASQKIPL